MKLLTIDELLERTEKSVVLPTLSKESGEEVAVRVRRIGRAEYLLLLPPLPPEAATWPEDELAARELAWLETLSEEQRTARRAQLRDATYKLVELAAVEPRLTAEHARHLGDDAAVISIEVLRLSGLLAAGVDAAAPTTG